ncbi:MAG TPA: Crp/Fnr family transcriptional regulator [Microscillaceae bacterium]|nr:Crp/Fnr family transcriptional regulator [Microscillaceae bacterium]
MTTTLQQYFNAISPISPKTWEAIEPLFQPANLPAETYFVKQNVIAKEMAFLESGCVRAFFTNAEGKEYNKQFFVGPSIIGPYTSLLQGTPNLIPQQALTDCKIWVANYQALEQQYAEFHDLERLARKIAEYYFLEKERKELEMALQDATQRYFNFRQQFPTLEQLIPQYHIASYLGISATQLSRIRRKLTDQA